jgi:chemotaxis protein methyltransferase CheR
VDLILCRNVMIYFDERTIQQVVTGLRRSLAPQGWLLVGHAEGNSEVFRSLHTHQVAGTVLFRNGPPVEAPNPLPPVSRPLAPAVQERVGVMETPSPVLALQSWQPYRLVEPAPRRPLPAAPPVPAVEPRDPLDEVRSLVDQGAWAAASERLPGILVTESLNPEVHYYHGLVLAQLGSHAEAEAALRRALFLDPGLPLAYYHLGLLLAGRGAHSEAHKAFRNTLRVVENLAGDVKLAGSDLTISRLRDATLLQIAGARP